MCFGHAAVTNTPSPPDNIVAMRQKMPFRNTPFKNGVAVACDVGDMLRSNGMGNDKTVGLSGQHPTYDTDIKTTSTAKLNCALYLHHR